MALGWLWWRTWDEQPALCLCCVKVGGRLSPIFIAAIVALTLHRCRLRPCACVPVPRRPTYCRLSPCGHSMCCPICPLHWPEVKEGARAHRAMRHVLSLRQLDAISVTNLHARFPFSLLVCPCLVFSSLVCGWSLAKVQHGVPRDSGNFDPAPLTLCVTVHVFLYQAERPDVVCHLVGRGCGMTRSCVLEANARFPTEYDSKGYGLLRRAGHTLGLWPVSSCPCDCRTSRLGFHHVTWEAISLPHIILHTQLCHTIFHRPLCHTQLCHTQLCHTHTHARTHTHTQHCHTHHLCHTPYLSHATLHIQLFNWSILHHLLCLCFFSPPTGTFVSACWNKLTCAVLRSFNFQLTKEFSVATLPSTDAKSNAEEIGKDPHRARMGLWLCIAHCHLH